MDKRKEKGSPLVICDQVKKALEGKTKKKVEIYLNDNDPKKIEELEGRIRKLEIDDNICFHFKCKELHEAFMIWFLEMHDKHAANFLFMDPTGLKITKEIFEKITKLDKTDFIFLFHHPLFVGLKMNQT